MKTFGHLIFVGLSFLSSAWGQELRGDPAETSGPTAQSWAQFSNFDFDFRIRGQVQLLYDQLPSSRDGVQEFSWQSLLLKSVLKQKEGPFSLYLQGQWGPDRDLNSQQPLWLWDEFFLSSQGAPQFSIGVLHHPVLEFSRDEAGFAFWSKEARPALEKWGYLFLSDMGLRLATETEHGLWVFQVSNGEGFPNTESGPRKDWFLGLTDERVLSAMRLRFQIYHQQGGYDSLGAAGNVKQRSGLQLAMHFLDWSFGGHLALTHDSVDGVTGKVAESVDLSAKGGDSVRGQILESWLQYRFAESPVGWSAQLQLAQVHPDLDQKQLQVQSAWLGLVKNWAAGVQTSLIHEQTKPSQEVSASALDRQRWILAFAMSLKN